MPPLPLTFDEDDDSADWRVKGRSTVGASKVGARVGSGARMVVVGRGSGVDGEAMAVASATIAPIRIVLRLIRIKEEGDEEGEAHNLFALGPIRIAMTAGAFAFVFASFVETFTTVLLSSFGLLRRHTVASTTSATDATTEEMFQNVKELLATKGPKGPPPQPSLQQQTKRRPLRNSDRRLLSLLRSYYFFCLCTN